MKTVKRLIKTNDGWDFFLGKEATVSINILHLGGVRSHPDGGTIITHDPSLGCYSDSVVEYHLPDTTPQELETMRIDAIRASGRRAGELMRNKRLTKPTPASNIYYDPIEKPRVKFNQYIMKSFDEVTHEEMVAILTKPGADILNSLTPTKCDLWHVGGCAAPEVGELFEAIQNQDRENIIEELGDLEFYLARVRQIVGVQYQEFVSATRPLTNRWARPQDGLVVYTGQLFDALKRWVIYEKNEGGSVTGTEVPGSTRTAIVAALGEIESNLGSFRGIYGITREAVLEANKKKLEKRYASLGYSNDQAQDRADKSVVVEPTLFKNDEGQVIGSKNVDVAELVPTQEVTRPGESKVTTSAIIKHFEALIAGGKAAGRDTSADERRLAALVDTPPPTKAPDERPTPTEQPAQHKPRPQRSGVTYDFPV